MLGYFSRDERAEVAGVLAFGVQQVVFHQPVDTVNAAGERLGEASAPYDGVEVEGYSGFFKPLHDELLAVFILVADVDEGGQFAHVMVRAGHPDRLLVLVDGYLRRRGTRVYN